MCVTCRAQQHAQHLVAQFFDAMDEARCVLRGEELAALQGAFVNVLKLGIHDEEDEEEEEEDRGS